MTSLTAERVLDEAYFRRVMGAYPTGVVAVTAIDEDGKPVAMLLGSFGSVSLDPPLVMYMPTKTSSSYASLKGARTWCVNILGHDQETLCRTLSLKGAVDKFDGVSWRPSETGAPIIDGSVAWVECETEIVHDGGDHDIVIGRVLDLATLDRNPELPMVFYQGGYGRLTPNSRVVPASADTLALLRIIDDVRPHMESLASATGMEVEAAGQVGHWIVALAGAGTPTEGDAPSRIGIRLPFEAPMGPLFVAWEDEATRRRWLREGLRTFDEAMVARQLAALDRIRDRGWTVTLYTPELRDLDEHLYRYAGGDASAWGDLRLAESRLDPQQAYEAGRIEPNAVYSVRNVAAPVKDAEGRVVLYLLLRGFPDEVSGERLLEAIARLVEVSADASGGSR